MAKTLKIKKAEPTISAKPVTAAPDGGADGAAPAGEAAPAQPSGGIYVSARHKIENAGIGVATRPERFGWAAVLAVVATALFVCVLIMEFADWSALKFA